MAFAQSALTVIDMKENCAKSEYHEAHAKIAN